MASELRSVLDDYRLLLLRHRSSLDAMNVFPVPDADTGTNMLRTVEAICHAVAQAESDQRLAESIARGALEGSRGNSGLLLGQYLTALSLAVDDQRWTARRLADGLRLGAEAAREVLADPVEGTFLSVADAAARGKPCEGLDQDSGLVAAAAAARSAGVMALLGTPQQLPVLAEAGVLDAGGAGLTLLFDAIWYRLTGIGGAAAEINGLGAQVSGAASSFSPGFSGFELQFTTQGERRSLQGLLETLGESVAVASKGSELLAHVHVNDPGAAISALYSALASPPAELRIEPLLVVDLSEASEAEAEE